jgi:hypothetical protein
MTVVAAAAAAAAAEEEEEEEESVGKLGGHTVHLATCQVHLGY